METKRLERTQEAAKRKKEQRQRKQALNEASALPRQEAEKSMQRRVQDMMQPLIADVREIKEQLQGNRSAPVAADAGGASTKSAKKSRKHSPKNLRRATRQTQIRTPHRKPKEGRRRSACDLGSRSYARTLLQRLQAQRKPETVQERQDPEKVASKEAAGARARQKTTTNRGRISI